MLISVFASSTSKVAVHPASRFSNLSLKGTQEAVPSN
jgi:hypothetical protein